MRFKLMLLTFVLVVFFAGLALPGSAQDQINYISQPDELTVFLNDVVFVRDVLRVPLDVETHIVLPTMIFQDTLILRDETGRLPLYSIGQQAGQVVLTIRGGEAQTSASGVRQLTLEYITLGGIRWQPRYDMRLATSDPENVGFDFFAQIQNDAFTLEATQVNLVAGRVNVSGQTPLPIPALSANQAFTDMLATATPGTPSGGGLTTISATGDDGLATQAVYRLPPLSSQPGETLYAELLETTFPARTILLWNAATDRQVSVIYKVRNNAPIALADGIVRNYQDGLFSGSDEIEYTPPGGEGSVTVGPLRDVRVRKTETTTAVDAINRDDGDGIESLHEITLTLSNLAASEHEIEVVDIFPDGAFAFEFALEAERQGGNVLRWLPTLAPGAEIIIAYRFRTAY